MCIINIIISLIIQSAHVKNIIICVIIILGILNIIIYVINFIIFIIFIIINIINKIINKFENKIIINIKKILFLYYKCSQYFLWK